MIPLVLLPALLCDAELYAAQVATLTDVAEPRVLSAAESSLEASTQAVLRDAPPRFALAGTSAGANLALEILAADASRVAGLWLMGCNPGVSGDPAGARRLSERARAGEFAAVVDELAARVIYSDGPRASVSIAAFRRMAHRTGADEMARRNDALIARADRRPVLDTLRVPTLLVWGREDTFSSVERAHEIAARVPTSELIVLEHCGHLPTLEYPDDCTRAARAWLKRL